MNQFRWAIAVASAVVAAGCTGTLEPVSNTTLGDNGIRLTVAASSQEIVGGSPVTVHATLTNEGAESVTLHFSDGCQINPSIRNSDGQVVLAGGGCITMLTDLTLAPLQNVERDFVWTGSTEFTSEMPLRPLPAGMYRFIVNVPAAEGTLSAGVEITLK
jgi:hypothetical protein